MPIKIKLNVNLSRGSTSRGRCTRFFSGEGREVAGLRFEILHGFQPSDSSVGSTVHTKMGPSKVGDVIAPPGPWSTFGPDGVISEDLPLPRWPFLGMLVTWRSLYSEKWLRGFTNFKITHFCREVSRCEHFAKIAYLPLALEMYSFSHCPRLMTIDEDRNKKTIKKLTALRCLKSPVLLTQSNKSSRPAIRVSISLFCLLSLVNATPTKVLEVLDLLQWTAA